MRNPDETGGLSVAPAQVQTSLDNWYTAQLRRRRRLKRGYKRNGVRDGRRLGNTGAQNPSNRRRQATHSQQLGLANMYQYNNSGKVFGDTPPPIDEHAILIHVGGNAHGIKPYPNDEEKISIRSNLRGPQAGSVSIIKTNVEWQKFEWKENIYQTLRKPFGDARVEFSTSKAKF
jgi:hypothetical protein